MRIIARSTLKAFWGNPVNLDSKEPLLSWYAHVRRAEWSSPAELKADFGAASILKDGRAVFNIAGNKYRLVVWVNYVHQVVYIRFVGTHAQYDRINAQTV